MSQRPGLALKLFLYFDLTVHFISYNLVSM